MLFNGITEGNVLSQLNLMLNKEMRLPVLALKDPCFYRKSVLCAHSFKCAITIFVFSKKE